MFQIDMRTTSATAKARGEQDQASVCSPGDDASRITYISTKQFHLHGRRRKLPRVMLAVLCILFCSSAGGIALAVVLILDPVEVRGACLSRDFILYAALLSLLYIALHIRAALRDHVGTQKGPPQYMYGDYLHASALIVARLSIVAWICALVATAAMIANASPLPLGGLASKSPILNLLICIGALPSFAIILCTIEEHSTTAPFATAGFSTPSLLTCRVSAFAEDLAAGGSVSRRGSVQEATDKGEESSSSTTMSSAGMFRPLESHAAAMISQDRSVDGMPNRNPPSSPTSQLPIGVTRAGPHPSTISNQTADPPKPAYLPGGWRTEFGTMS